MSSSDPDSSAAQRANRLSRKRAATYAAGAGAPGEARLRLVREGARKAFDLEMDDIRYGLKIAADRMRRGDFHGAMSFYAMLVVLEPKESEFHQGMANCALRLGQFETALRGATAASLLNARNYKASFIAAQANFALRRRDEALRDLEMARELAEGAGDSAFGKLVRAMEMKLEALGAAASR